MRKFTIVFFAPIDTELVLRLKYLKACPGNRGLWVFVPRGCNIWPTCLHHTQTIVVRGYLLKNAKPKSTQNLSERGFHSSMRDEHFPCFATLSSIRLLAFASANKRFMVETQGRERRSFALLAAEEALNAFCSGP